MKELWSRPILSSFSREDIRWESRFGELAEKEDVDNFWDGIRKEPPFPFYCFRNIKKFKQFGLKTNENNKDSLLVV